MLRWSSVGLVLNHWIPIILCWYIVVSSWWLLEGLWTSVLVSRSKCRLIQEQQWPLRTGLVSSVHRVTLVLHRGWGLQQGRPFCCVVGVAQTDPGFSLVLNVGISDDVSCGFADPDTNADPDVLTFDESNSNQSVHASVIPNNSDLHSVHPEPVCEHLWLTGF